MAVRIDVPAPPTPTDKGGGGSEWVGLFVAPNDIEAHLLQGRLRDADIETRSIKDRTGPTWLYGGSDPWAPVLVLVRRFELESARIVLAEIAYEAPAAIPQPEPPSESRWKGAVLWWTVAIGLGVLLTGTALMRTAASIKTCDLPLLCGGHSEQEAP